MSTVRKLYKHTHAEQRAPLDRETLWASGKLLYTIKEVAFLLSMSEKSVRRLIKRGLLKVNPALRVQLLTRDEIQAFANMTR